MSDNRKSILMRAYFVYVMVLIFGIVIVGKIIYIQWGQGEYWKKQAEDLAFKEENVEAQRGNIYADDESLLATSVKIYDVGIDVNPKIVPDSIFYDKVDSLAAKLGKLFSQPKNSFLQKIANARENYASAKIGYVLLKRNVSYAQLKEIEKFPILKWGRYKGGLVVDEREIREMPYKSLAKRTIGYVKLAQFDININLGKGNIPKEKYFKYADTLAFCMYNLFHDGYSKKSYRQLLDKSYALKEVIKKRVDSRQLGRIQDFPLINELGTETGFAFIQKKEEYKIGLEGSFNELLSGRDGTRIMKKIGAEAWTVVSDKDLVEPLNGFDIHTSIDINLQDVADNVLRKCLDSNNAKWGCCILMEVKTGFVKAIVNLSRDSSGRYDEKYNYAIREQIEPGSTFKLASIIAVLEEGEFDTSSVVPKGKGRVGKRDVEDSHPEMVGFNSLAKAFENSSNLGISFATYNTFYNKIVKFKELLEKMGVTKTLGIEIAGEPMPSMNISLRDLETIPYGYVVKMTPLQILAFYNAVANNGILVRPRFVKSLGKVGKITYTSNPTILRKEICSKETLLKMKKLLEGVVRRGTASNINNSVYNIAGKTGTVKIHENKKYIEKYVASFVGYFPTDEPQYTCIVVVSRPNGSEYYGSQIAAPVFKEIADKVYATRLDIRASEEKRKIAKQPPISCNAFQKDMVTVYNGLNFKSVTVDISSLWASAERSENYVKLKPKNSNDKLTPDVTGMGARDAIFLLESLGLKVRVTGKGFVVKQIPQPGKKITLGQQITLNLSI